MFVEVVSIQPSKRWMSEMRNSPIWAVEGMGAGHMLAAGKQAT